MSPSASDLLLFLLATFILPTLLVSNIPFCFYFPVSLHSYRRAKREGRRVLPQVKDGHTHTKDNISDSHVGVVAGTRTQCSATVRPHGTTRFALHGFSWNWMSIFRKSVEKIQVALKSDKNNGYFTWRPMYVYDISLKSFRMRNVSEKSLWENKSTHFMFSNFPPPPPK
jgi:hypothetical protein